MRIKNKSPRGIRGEKNIYGTWLDNEVHVRTAPFFYLNFYYNNGSTKREFRDGLEWDTLIIWQFFMTFISLRGVSKKIQNLRPLKNRDQIGIRRDGWNAHPYTWSSKITDFRCLSPKLKPNPNFIPSFCYLSFSLTRAQFPFVRI